MLSESLLALCCLVESAADDPHKLLSDLSYEHDAKHGLSHAVEQGPNEGLVELQGDCWRLDCCLDELVTHRHDGDQEERCDENYFQGYVPEDPETKSYVHLSFSLLAHCWLVIFYFCSTLRARMIRLQVPNTSSSVRFK